jgi:cell division protein FtsB
MSLTSLLAGIPVNANLRMKMVELEAENKTLKEKNASLQLENEVLKKKNAELEDQVRRLAIQGNSPSVAELARSLNG